MASEKEYTKSAAAVARLSEIQCRVTQYDETEPAFSGEYVDNQVEGIYVDLVSGEPLFSSQDKFDSGSGWPSFSKPIAGENVVEKLDNGHGTRRVEVRSKYADSHLGHVFSGGPGEFTGLRYRINSASLRFIPADEMEKLGYGELLKSFENG